MEKGKLIVLEGIDGSGKTVQMELLEQHLLALGKRVKVLSFPVYESFFGREIGDMLSARKGVSASDVDAKSMCLWFALDRFDAFQNCDLQDVDVLLLNRYVLSNAVYQSIRERDLHNDDLLDFVYALEHERFGLPVPDAYVYLDVHCERAGANVDEKGYREYVGNARDVYESQAGMQQRARMKYLEYAQRLPNVFVIDCMQENQLKSPEEIAKLVRNTLHGHSLLENRNTAI